MGLVSLDASSLLYKMVVGPSVFSSVRPSVRPSFSHPISIPARGFFHHQVLLQPRLADGKVPVPDKRKQPNAADTSGSEFLMMAGIDQHSHIPTSFYYIHACGGELSD